MTANEVAERLSISKSQAYNLIEQGDIPKVQIRSSVRVKEEDLEQYIKENLTCTYDTPIKYQARRANGEFGDQSSQPHLSQGVSS